LTTINNYPTKKRRFYRKFTVLFSVWFFLNILLIAITPSVDVHVRAIFSLGWETTLIFVAHLILIIMYNPALDTSNSFPFHSMKSEDMMSGKSKYRVIENPRRAQRRKKYGFENDNELGGDADEEYDDDNTQLNATHNLSNGLADDGAKGLVMTEEQQAVAFQSPLRRQSLEETPIIRFSSVEEATEAVKDAGDAISALLHGLLVNLDTLDDAMDDWDSNPAEEEGDDYENLEDEYDDGFNNRRLSIRQR